MHRLPLLALAALCFLPGCGGDQSTKPPSADTTPPARVTDLAVTSPPGRRVTLTWTAPAHEGEGNRASRYEIRCATTPLTEERWDSAAVVASPPAPKAAGQGEQLDVAGLADGTWHFALKSADAVPNWSAMSNEVTATVADATPPAAVTDLAVSTITAQGVTLTWTAPGNDGTQGRAAQYDMRYAQETITAQTWSAATRVQGIPAPAAAGTAESFLVTGLTSGRTYSFALETADETPNWSALSNVANAWFPDYYPPDAVSDLTVSAGTAQSVTLTWTAPGNDGALGRATQYDLRYGLAPFINGGWDAATRVQGVPPPDTAGTRESVTVTGLAGGQLYYFAFRTGDAAPNWSLLSNTASVTVQGFSLRRLTTYPGTGYGAWSPTWSPDGQAIAFSADWSGHEEIYRIPAAGGSPVQLTHDTGRNRTPAWSPDGRTIAFNTNRAGGKQELWLMNAADGAQAARFVAVAGTDIGPCAWSHDGTRIAYQVGVPMVTVEPSEIDVIPVAGGNPEKLVGGDCTTTEPAWSPDGTKIALCYAPAYFLELYVQPVAGGNPIPLTNDRKQVRFPTWSPDGSRIAFASNRGGTLEIWIIPATGGTPALLTSSPQGDWSPAWSPGGGEIAFESDRSDHWEIWILTFE